MFSSGHELSLVDEDGIIYPRAFYNYLSTWTTNDAHTYDACQANFHPRPKDWMHDPDDYQQQTGAHIHSKHEINVN